MFTNDPKEDIFIKLGVGESQIKFAEPWDM
jgi:hypothetical protein